ncbi:MAG: CinA family nicotinamide mononucleotide deamidase-related protein [Chloroflexota bacterium]
MRAEVISIGTELLLGNILDTNTHFLANELASLGIDLYFTSSVGDNRERLAGVLRQAWERSGLILTTGGLGPTQGDITREVIAGFLGEEPRVDPALKQSLVNFFTQRGLEMPPNNIKQATLIPSSSAILNPMGTAPGWWVEKDGRILIAMPGPPGEMQFMWQNEVARRLRERGGGVILSRTIKTFGLSEAKVDELLAPLLAAANPTLATYAKPDGIHLRITAKSAQKLEAQDMISRREAEIRGILGDSIWGFDDETQGEVVGRLLTARRLSLAVAESFTGGFLTQILAGTSRSQEFLRGALITASGEAKVAVGLAHHLATGGASHEAATEMASLVRRKFGASIGISIEGGSESADPASMAKVFIATDSQEIAQRGVQSYTGRLYQMKSRAAYHALFHLMRLFRPG